MSRSRLPALAALAAGLAAGGAGAEPSVAVVALPFRATELRGPASHAALVLPSTEAGRRDPALRPGGSVLAWGTEGAAALVLAGGAVRAVTIPHPGDEAFGERPGDGLPGSRLASSGPITAHLAEGGRPRDGAAPGTPPGAARLVIRERLPVPPGEGVRRVPMRVTALEAGPEAAFESLEPRLADLDGDGVPEVLAVRSQAGRGASLAVAARRGEAWTIVAETPAAGEPDAWLNPAAVADLDGDGRPEIALVRAPHRTGTLQVWSLEGGSLVLKREAQGYANHAPGSSATELAAAADIDGDGAAELALPTLDRRALAILSLKGGVREVGRAALPSRALTGVAALGSGRDARFLVGLEDGRIAEVRP